MSHGFLSSLAGLVTLLLRDPPMNRWAIFFRPAGLREIHAVMAQCVAKTPEFLNDVGHATDVIADHSDDTDKTSREAGEKVLPQRRELVSRRSDLFKALHLVGNLPLKLADFIEGAFGEDRKIPRILSFMRTRI